MNIDIAVRVTLAMLILIGKITEEEAREVFNKAELNLTGKRLDKYSIDELVNILKGQ